MFEDNDPDIKVTVRTGTSTRPPQMRNSDSPTSYMSHARPINYTLPINYVNLTLGDFRSNPPYYRDIMELLNREILNNSLYSNDLHRDPNIELDITQRNCETSDLSEQCLICLSNFAPEDKLTTIGCNHIFHYDCLKKWGQYKQECPHCRFSIPILER